MDKWEREMTYGIHVRYMCGCIQIKAATSFGCSVRPGCNGYVVVVCAFARFANNLLLMFAVCRLRPASPAHLTCSALVYWQHNLRLRVVTHASLLVYFRLFWFLAPCLPGVKAIVTANSCHGIGPIIIGGECIRRELCKWVLYGPKELLSSDRL